MEFGSPTLWWVLAGVLVAAELVSGTFYLLNLALGAVAAALAAHLGLGGAAQLVAGAVVGAGAVTGWHLKRRRQPPSAPARSNRDVNLDIGETLRVEQWDADGRAQVSYRGASWAARFDGTGAPQAGMHVIRAIDGNVLKLDRAT